MLINDFTHKKKLPETAASGGLKIIRSICFFDRPGRMASDAQRPTFTLDLPTMYCLSRSERWQSPANRNRR